MTKIGSYIIKGAFMIVIIIFCFYWLYQSSKNNTVVTFITYTNEKYGFSIDYPSDWRVFEFNGDTEPIFIFHPKSIEHMPPSYRHNRTLVAVYPQGWPGHGIEGETSSSTTIIIPGSIKQDNFILSDGSIYVMFSRFESPVSTTWNESGFVMARLKVRDLQHVCVSKPNPNECDYFEGDKFITQGTVADEANRKVIEHMLASFRFIQ